MQSSQRRSRVKKQVKGREEETEIERRRMIKDMRNSKRNDSREDRYCGDGKKKSVNVWRRVK